jgi:hypothetical protein
MRREEPDNNKEKGQTGDNDFDGLLGGLLALKIKIHALESSQRKEKMKGKPPRWRKT